jgi:hypothetical protein
MAKSILVLALGRGALTDTTVGREYPITKVVAPNTRCTDGTPNLTDFNGLEFVDDVGDTAVVIDGPVDPQRSSWEVIE